jgi:hypothetical protein
MSLFRTVYKRWRRIDPNTRAHVKNTATWVGVFMVFWPGLMYFFVVRVYDMQSEAAVRIFMPDEVNDENLEKWRKKQLEAGRTFSDEKLQ